MNFWLADLLFAGPENGNVVEVEPLRSHENGRRARKRAPVHLFAGACFVSGLTREPIARCKRESATVYSCSACT